MFQQKHYYFFSLSVTIGFQNKPLANSWSPQKIPLTCLSSLRKLRNFKQQFTPHRFRMLGFKSALKFRILKKKILKKALLHQILKTLALWKWLRRPCYAIIDLSLKSLVELEGKFQSLKTSYCSWFPFEHLKVFSGARRDVNMSICNWFPPRFKGLKKIIADEESKLTKFTFIAGLT